MRAMRAQAGLVLHGNGVVAVERIGLVVAQLQAQQATLLNMPVMFSET